MTMFDHIALRTGELRTLVKFYEAALGPLGYTKLVSFDDGAGFGADRPTLWIGEADDEPSSVHIALTAPNTAAVDAFYRAAMAAGGKDNGAPGPRPDYEPGYYAAFVIDPDGNNLEAVHHQRA
jgi:catechol 2,3-dioxygenase-like lactoylglutathione lyase family enzyme